MDRMADDDSAARPIAIAGGGASGLLVAVQLLRRGVDPARIMIVEPRERLGRGVAYSTTRAEHLLNVVAARMSAFDDDASHFLRWLESDAAAAAEVLAADAGGGRALADCFAPRRVYARYLDEVFATEPGSADVRRHRDTVVDAIPLDGGGLRLRLEQAGDIDVAVLVLAAGNEARRVADGALPSWDDAALRAVGEGDAVAIVGAGLSMVDAVLSLQAQGHRGDITVVSRHGMAPLAHAAPGTHAHETPRDDRLLAAGMRERLRRVRARVRATTAAGAPWQWAIDALRPQVQSLWREASDVERARFLRHLVRLWDIHRHRIAPQVAALLDALQADGRLRIVAGRLQGGITRGDDGRAWMRLLPRGGGDAIDIVADHVFDATGVEGQLARMRNPLLQALVARGLAVPGGMGIGVATDDAGRLVDAEGRVHGDIAVIGGLRIGQLWESIAMPELRGQARDVAALVADAR